MTQKSRLIGNDLGLYNIKSIIKAVCDFQPIDISILGTPFRSFFQISILYAQHAYDADGHDVHYKSNFVDDENNFFWEKYFITHFFWNNLR